MRSPQRVAAHLLQLANAVVLHGIRYSSADPGMVLVIARSLQLHNLAIEKKSLIGIEGDGTNPETGLVAVDHAGFASYFRHQLVQIPLFERPKERLFNIHCLLISLRLPVGNRLWGTGHASNRFSRRA